MLCLDNSFCSGQSCWSTRYLVRKYLKVLTFSIMLLGRIHFNMVWLAAHNYAQRSAVCGVGAESRWRVFLHSWCDEELCCNLFILALAKTVTLGGSPRREPGQAVALATKPPLIYPIVAPRSANDIYRPVSNSYFFKVNPTGTLRTSASYMLMYNTISCVAPS